LECYQENWNLFLKTGKQPLDLLNAESYAADYDDDYENAGWVKTDTQFQPVCSKCREPNDYSVLTRGLCKNCVKGMNAESFSASGGGDLTYEGGRMVAIEEVTIVDYNWHTEPDETDDIDESDIESQVQEKVENEMYEGDSGNDSWSYGTDSDGTNVEVYYEWNKTVEDGGEEFIKGW
jgi:hypothetical protein